MKRLGRILVKRLIVLSPLLSVSLLGCILFDPGAKGQGYRYDVTEGQTPPAAVTAFRMSHPDAQIQRIQLIVSNAPMSYWILFKETGVTWAEYGYQAFDFREGSDGEGSFTFNALRPPELVLASFHHRQPDGRVERCEHFMDGLKQSDWYRLTYRTSDARSAKVSFSPEGTLYDGIGNK